MALDQKNTVNPLIVIVGETGSGKSALAMDLAGHFKGEIICADSWTVYKDFNIGTAKPEPEQQSRIRHHLLDVADPILGYSAAEFKKQAMITMENIKSRDKIPFLVGGSGLYVDSILYDYGFLAPSSSDMRASLNLLSIDELLRRIQANNFNLDGIDVRNKRRLIRLLETGGLRPRRSDLRSNTLILGISTDRERLQERIVRRVDYMFNAGLEQEVTILKHYYGWETEPMKGIGYREFKEYFIGTQTIEQTRERIINATMQLAKKQRTWFKRNKSIQWLDDPSNAVDIITTFLNKLGA